MKCPIDGAQLTMTDRQGIEIDYCPQCRGVWLDRGELDKIIERGTQQQPQPQATFAPPPPQAQPQQAGYPDRHYSDRGNDRHPDQRYDPRYDNRRKKKSFLDDLFDFG